MADGTTLTMQVLIENYNASRIFYTIAGISGALAIALSAYGSHSKVLNEPENAKSKQAFDFATKHHLIHSVVLLALPLMRKPLLVGCLLLAGQLIFCGSLYVYGFTRNPKTTRFAPIGGYLLIAAWLAIAFS